MKLDRQALKTERQWRAATGKTEAQFMALLWYFTRSYESMFGETIEERTSKSPNQPTLTSYEDLLFFTLFSIKSGLTYDLLGFVSGMDASNAKRNQTLGLEVLEQALVDSNNLPKRQFVSAEEFKAYFEKHKTLLFDATEHRTQRPSEEEAQIDNYSGKKKPTR
jgi:hypothetical protein